MSIQINIQGTLIDFPTSGQSPNWAPAIVEFAQAVEKALDGVANEFDVPPSVVNILNGVTGENISALSFASSVVRSAEIKYSVYRKNDDPYLEAESGTLTVVYTGSDWAIQREFMSNRATPSVTFFISSTGQVSYNSELKNSLGYEGKLSFSAQTLLQTEI